MPGDMDSIVERLDRLERLVVDLPPDLYADVQQFNQLCLPGMVDNTEAGWPHDPGPDSRHLGAHLILEEMIETMNALRVRFEVHGYDADRPMVLFDHYLSDEEVEINFNEVADGVADMIYVCFGMLLRLGLTREQFYRVWREVTRANMDKANGPLREDGKRLKPEGWRPPDIAGALRGSTGA